MRMKFLMTLILLFCCNVVLVGCQREQDPFEETGEAFEKAGDRLGDAIEDTGDRMD